jgi:hypothetical protein
LLKRIDQSFFTKRKPGGANNAAESTHSNVIIISQQYATRSENREISFDSEKDQRASSAYETLK